MISRPYGWKSISLGASGKWLSGGTPLTTEPLFWGGDIPWISSGSLTNSRLSTSERQVTPLGSLSGTRMVEPNTILMVVRGMSLKTEFRIGMATKSMAFGQDCKALVAGPGLDPHFLYYAISARTQQILGIVDEAGHGTGRLNTDQLFAVPINVPGSAEQQAIAEVLGALDDKIAANTILATQITELASLTYSASVKDLPTQAMSDVLVPVLGGTPTRSQTEFWTGSNLWASARDVTGAGSGVIVDTDEKISDAAVTNTKAKPLPAGSVILTARGTVGAVARLATASSFNQSCYGFAPGALPAGILYFAIVSATERAKAFAHGSVFDTITMRTFDHLTVPTLLPSQMDQIEGQIQPLLDTITMSLQESRTLAATRDALLPQLMSGKLRVKDAEKSLAGVL